MLLRTEQLTKDYGHFLALDRLDLDIAPGEIFGLLGPNGSGKSTALRLILGFLQPTSGRAFIAGHECWHHGVEARRQVAYLPGELQTLREHDRPATGALSRAVCAGCRSRLPISKNWRPRSTSIFPGPSPTSPPA